MSGVRDDSPTLEAPGAGFAGALVLAFESRKASEMTRLIERYGGRAVSAPAIREVPLVDHPDALAFLRALDAGELDVVVLMTGVGTRTLVSALGGEVAPGDLAARLSRARVIVRGPKPASALRELGVRNFGQVPEPNTWREVLNVLKAEGFVADGKRIAVQEYGAPSQALYDALAAAGAIVTRVSVYAWALPDDTTPLRKGLHAIASGGVKIALFTSASQVEHALRVAAQEGIANEVVTRLRSGCIASIGPVCSDALRAEGLPPDIEPEHSKMGHLVKAASMSAREVLKRKSA
jgi:uroporphyrinogen-III synthase